MGDDSKQEYGLTPYQEIEMKKKLKKIWRDSHRQMMQNSAEGKRIDHQQIEEAVQKKIEEKLRKGELLIDEQAIRAKIIAKKDALIDNLTQRALLMLEKESHQEREELIDNKLESVSGIVSLNQIEEEAQKEINRRNQEFNKKMRSIVGFFDHEAQKIREGSKSEEKDNQDN